MQEITIIIPCYNEAERLPCSELICFLEENLGINLCLVNDGSSDNTKPVLNSLKIQNKERIYIVDLDKNKGKGEAIRIAANFVLQNTKSEYIAYFDADLATPLEEIDLLYSNLVRNPNLIMAFGSRWKRLGATIERTAKRNLTGRVFATFASWILRLPVYDTQCGAKLMTRECAQIAFKEEFLSRWLFDVEIFARLRNHFGFPKIFKILIEVPLNIWVEKGDSRIKFTYFFKVPFELLRINLKYSAPKSTKL